MVYAQGNWISAIPETPYLQIGESKYGKPALDHIVHPGLSLDDGYQRIYWDPIEATDLYTRQCALSVSTRDFAMMAATLANGGATL